MWGEWVLPLHSELIPWNAEQKQRKVLIRLLFATLRYGLFSFPLCAALLSTSLSPPSLISLLLFFGIIFALFIRVLPN